MNPLSQYHHHFAETNNSFRNEGAEVQVRDAHNLLYLFDQLGLVFPPDVLASTQEAKEISRDTVLAVQELFCCFCGTAAHATANKRYSKFSEGPKEGTSLCLQHKKSYELYKAKLEKFRSTLTVDQLNDFFIRFEKDPKLMTEEERKEAEPKSNLLNSLSRKFKESNPKNFLKEIRFCQICGVTQAEIDMKRKSADQPSTSSQAAKKTRTTWRYGTSSSSWFCEKHGKTYSNYIKRAQQKKARYTEENVKEAYAARFTKDPRLMKQDEVKALRALEEPYFSLQRIEHSVARAHHDT